MDFGFSTAWGREPTYDITFATTYVPSVVKESFGDQRSLRRQSMEQSTTSSLICKSL
jgi:hypothetical protein